MNINFSKTQGFKKYMFYAVSCLLIVSLTAMPAKAYDWQNVTVHVVSIAPVGFPGYVEFTADTGPSTCSNLFFYIPQGADEATQQTNAKGVLAIVMAAQLTGHALNLAGINPTGTSGLSQFCQIQYIWAGNS